MVLPSSGAFYIRPLASRFCGNIRYSKQKVGIHQFEGLMQNLVKDAGLEGYFTGHSGKVSTYTKVGYIHICGIILHML